METLGGERRLHKPVRIGLGQARIVSVTARHLVYHDEGGSEHAVDLSQCAAQWARWRSEHAAEFVLFSGVDAEASRTWNAQCVGERGACDDPPWVELRSEPRTRFEFQNYDSVYADLLRPLGVAGWHTFDAN